MRWGLIPSWAKSASAGNRMINARAETVAERHSFRIALQRRRCLVLADGFYEWQRKGSGKRPMRIAMASGEPFAFAGLWDAWRDPKGEVVRSCAIITTSANESLSPIHDRMPVILPRDLESAVAGPRHPGLRLPRRNPDSLHHQRDGPLRGLLPGQQSRQRRTGSGCSFRAGQAGRWPCSEVAAMRDDELGPGDVIHA